MNECPPVAVPEVFSPPVEWCAGNRILRWDGKRITERPRVDPIVDGVYANATLQMQGGCIEAISEGTAVVYSACDPCVTPVTPPPDPAAITLSGDSCNLSTLDGSDQLLTQLFAVPVSTCIALSGCGTSFSPLQIGLNISPDPGNSLQCRANGLFSSNVASNAGANYSGCGIVIQNGLITQLPLPFQPVLSITSADGSILCVRSVDGCSFDLSNVAIGDGSGFSAGQILNYNTSADLPTTNAVLPVATVGTVNPRQLWIFVTGFGWREVQDSTNSSLRINF